MDPVTRDTSVTRTADTDAAEEKEEEEEEEDFPSTGDIKVNTRRRLRPPQLGVVSAWGTGPAPERAAPCTHHRHTQSRACEGRSSRKFEVPHTALLQLQKNNPAQEASIPQSMLSNSDFAGL